MTNSPPETSPILIGAALLGVGILLHRWQPDALSLPDTGDRDPGDRGARRAARKTRDGIAKVLPSNLTGSIGRSLLVMGAGLVLVRLLDMAVDDDAALF